MTLEELIGQTLVFGIPGTQIEAEDLRLFREAHAGGLILYRRNFRSPDQIKGLIRDLDEALGRRLLVATDHEGGRVVMLGEGVTVFPDNLALGTTGEAEYARRQGEIEAKELRRFGVDVNFAPVLDVLTDTYSPNIGTRSYGKDPELVARLGAARILAMQAGGLSACAKHFPGKGHSPLDAHLALPTIPSTWEEMQRLHLVPFLTAIEAGVECIMTSHPLYPALDPTPNCPATFSDRIVRGYLREELGYRGVIVSDDLEMGAIRELCPIREAAVHARRAGHDLLLACHDPRNQWAVFLGLLDAYKRKNLPWKGLEASLERIQALLDRRSRRFEGGPARPEPEGAPLAEEIARKGVRVLREGIPDLGGRLKRSVEIIFPRLSSLSPRITVERPLLDETAFLRGQLDPFGITPEIHVVGIEPSEEEIEHAAALASRADLTLLFLFDAHLFPSNRALLDRVQGSAQALGVVLLRNPYDVEHLREGILCLTAFGFRLCQLEAVIEALLEGHA